MARIRGELMLCNHDEAVSFFNRLIIDLKLQNLGQEPTEPITAERLNEASKHIKDIQGCQRPARVWR
jgi:hypothetical protein